MKFKNKNQKSKIKIQNQNKNQKLKITKIRSAKFYFHREMHYVTNNVKNNHDDGNKKQYNGNHN